MTRTAATSPAYVFAAEGDVFVAGLPSLQITRVAGIDAPAEPTGNADITLAADTANPATVEFQATSVPLGNTVTLRVTPSNSNFITVVSDSLAGTEDSSTASASVNLPDRASVLSATVSYTVVASLGDELSRFAQGERVERVELAAGPGGSYTTIFTVSGRRYQWPSNAVAVN